MPLQLKRVHRSHSRAGVWAIQFMIQAVLHTTDPGGNVIALGDSGESTKLSLGYRAGEKAAEVIFGEFIFTEAAHVGYKVSPRCWSDEEKTGRSVFREAFRLPEQFRAAGAQE